MAKKVVIERGSLDAVLEHLAVAARDAGSNVKAVGGICSAVAYMIAGSGSAGSSEHAAVMGAAEKFGFKPSYDSANDDPAASFDDLRGLLIDYVKECCAQYGISIADVGLEADAA